MATVSQPLPDTQNKSDASRGYSAILISQLTFSVTPVMLKFALNSGMPAIVVVFGRLALASLFITPFVLRNYRSELANINKRDLGMAMLAGFFLSLHFTGILLSLNHTTVLINQVVASTSPIWVAMLEVIFLKSRPKKLVWIALVIVILGSGLIALAGATNTLDDGNYNHLLGGLFALLAAFGIATYMVLSRQTRSKMPFLPNVWITFGCGAISAFGIVTLTGTPLTGYQPSAYGWLFLIAILSQLIGHSSVNFALGFLPPTIVSISGQIGVVTTAIVAFLALGERPQPLQIVGSGIIVVGVILAIIGQAQAPAKKIQEPANETPM